MKYVECVIALPIIAAGAIANWATRWFIAGWVFSREFWK